MPILSRKDLERISRRVLFRYLTLSDRKMDRIDPVDFAEKICGLHFAFADMSVTGSILGLTSYSDVDLTISVPRGNGSVQEFHLNGNIAYVDQNLANAGSVGRLNFTLVHEAAHQILGMLYPEEYNPSAQPFICRLADERCTYPITDWVEWQTNVLTAYLLLPRELIDRYMDELGLGRQINLLNKVFAPKEYALFSEMAKRLGVSKTALSIRLDNLGMIGRNDFSNPYAPIHNLTLRCYVVIELKTGEFKPEYAGQLNFYLSAVDGILKKEQDNPSIGLLLCKSKNDLVAEYSLKDMSKPIGVSAYQITSDLPEELERQLPSVEDIQKIIFLK